jgi:hypothetical protein
MRSTSPRAPAPVAGATYAMRSTSPRAPAPVAGATYAMRSTNLARSERTALVWI